MNQTQRAHANLIFKSADLNSAAILRALQRGAVTPNCLDITEAAATTAESLAGSLDPDAPVELHAVAQAIASHFHAAALTMQASAAVSAAPRCDLGARVLDNLHDSATQGMRAIRALVR